jgi:hypothetical protein
MFVLVTGTPGASKTSNVIARFMKETSRPIYYRGIRDLTLPWHELTDEQTKNWPDHVPDGGILIVDEAQQLWPVRPSSKPVPPGLTALETHRHHGWDVWFITQEPALLDVHARKIANEHYHYVRPFGAPFVTEYHSGTGAVSVSSTSDLKRCVQKRKPLPKEAWGCYKSAEIHTHKFRPPKILFVLLLALVAVPLGWYAFFNKLSDGGLAANGEVPEQAASQHQPEREADITGKPKEERKTWSELLKPEIAGLPFTAPLYADIARTPTAVPRLAGCVFSRRACTCYTQQGTTIPDVSRDMCVAFIRGGMFDHLATDDKGERASDGEARATPPAVNGDGVGPSVTYIGHQRAPRNAATL